MRRKTYLTHEQQWDHTVELAMKSGFCEMEEGDGVNRSWFIGRVVFPHRLFVPGDFVIVFDSRGNGMNQRTPVCAVSSKGRKVDGFYLGYSKCSHMILPNGKFYLKGYWDRKEGRMVKRWLRKRCRRALRKGDFENGPMRMVEVPDHLTGLQPDAPPLRQYIVALTREGRRMPGKRE